jgi:hypothetical protein
VAQLPAKDYRRGLLTTAERAIAAKSTEVEDLLAVIGDPETGLMITIDQFPAPVQLLPVICEYNVFSRRRN